MAGRLIAVANLKGGAGKTTLAVSLACALPGRVVVGTQTAKPVLLRGPPRANCLSR